MKHARAVAIVSLVISILMLIASLVIWVLAIMFGWLKSVEFVSHVSMLALVFAAASGISSGLAAYFAEESGQTPD